MGILDQWVEEWSGSICYRHNRGRARPCGEQRCDRQVPSWTDSGTADS
jgi:hypothetical protein